MPWTLAWPEVAVLDANAVGLGMEVRTLMEAAGAAVAAAAEALLAVAGGSVAGREVWVACGPGNNGGDGWVAARLLHERGVSVRALASHAAQQGEAAAAARGDAERAGVVTHQWSGHWSPPLSEVVPAVVIDGLLGVGPDGPGAAPRGAVAEVLAELRHRGASSVVLAVDVPTGLGSADVWPATRTITFHAPKMGLTGDSAVGELRVAPLPWPAEVEDVGPGEVLRWPPLEAAAHKGERGRLLIVGGGPHHGAPLLAGLAAGRVGCDLVHVAMPREAARRVLWPSALIMASLEDEVRVTPDGVRSLIARLADMRPKAILIGPGLGRHMETLAGVQLLLAHAAEQGLPVAVDADAIHALPPGGWPHGLQGVATPHAGELAAWLGGGAPADALAGLSGEDESVCIVTTGPTDRLAGPGGRLARALGGHPRMATGGTGDLLAGAITGLLAQGMAAWPSARLGAWLLRRAGELAVARHGPGVLASDVPPWLSIALRRALAPAS